MKLRGQLGFELDVFLQKRSKSLKGSRDDKIRKRSRICRPMPLLLQLIGEFAQAFVIAFCAAIVIDYLRSSSIGNSWIIAGIVVIALIFIEAFRRKSN